MSKLRIVKTFRYATVNNSSPYYVIEKLGDPFTLSGAVTNEWHKYSAYSSGCQDSFYCLVQAKEQLERILKVEQIKDTSDEVVYETE